MTMHKVLCIFEALVQRTRFGFYRVRKNITYQLENESQEIDE